MSSKKISFPSAVARQKRRTTALRALGATLAFILPFAIVYCIIFFNLPVHMTRYALLPALLSTLVVPLMDWNEVRWRRRISLGLLCPECLYPLDTELPDGQCPECGCRYDVETVRSIWDSEKKRLETRATQALALLGDGLGGLPAAIARHRRILIFYDLLLRYFMFIICIVFMYFWIIVFSMNVNVDIPYYIFTFVTCIWILDLIRKQHLHRLMRLWQCRIRDAACLLCPECLGQTEESSKNTRSCPDCGYTSTSDALAALWARERERSNWPKFSPRK